MEDDAITRNKREIKAGLDNGTLSIPNTKEIVVDPNTLEGRKAGNNAIIRTLNTYKLTPKKSFMSCRVQRKRAIRDIEVPGVWARYPQSIAEVEEEIILTDVVNPEAPAEDLILVVIRETEGPNGLMAAKSLLSVGTEEVCACVETEGGRPVNCTCSYMDLESSMAWYESQEKAAAS